MKIDLTIAREENGKEIEIDVECEFSYVKASRGHRDRYGAPEEPDEPASCDFEGAVRCDTGEDIELTEREIEKATEKAWDSLNDY